VLGLEPRRLARGKDQYGKVLLRHFTLRSVPIRPKRVRNKNSKLYDVLYTRGLGDRVK
jgi:hypothetical protein